jgi:hypothetical protein
MDSYSGCIPAILIPPNSGKNILFSKNVVGVGSEKE